LSFGSTKIIWNNGQGELDVYDNDSKAEDAKSEICGEGCEYRERNCKDEEKGQDYGIEWAEQLHNCGQLLKYHNISTRRLKKSLLAK
jgi:hypothetical protein